MGCIPWIAQREVLKGNFITLQNQMNYAGLNRYNPVTKKITHYQSSNGFPDSICWNDCISRDGVLWISTQGSDLLYRVDPFHKSIDSVPTVNQAVSFLEDREGYLWVGTRGSG